MVGSPESVESRRRTIELYAPEVIPRVRELLAEDADARDATRADLEASAA